MSATVTAAMSMCCSSGHRARARARRPILLRRRLRWHTSLPVSSSGRTCARARRLVSKSSQSTMPGGTCRIARRLQCSISTCVAATHATGVAGRDLRRLSAHARASRGARYLARSTCRAGGCGRLSHRATRSAASAPARARAGRRHRGGDHDAVRRSTKRRPRRCSQSTSGGVRLCIASMAISQWSR